MRRCGAMLVTAGLAAACFGMFAGCTTDRPEITITYTFRGEDYPVEYILSRDATPKTVGHFLELIEAGFYDGTCIHSYDSSYLYAGAYTFENGELEEIDYFSKVLELEESTGKKFTQFVFMAKDNEEKASAGDGLYTVYGEMQSDKYSYSGSRYSHSQGALVMYYTAPTAFTGDVVVQRNDGGSGREDKNAYQYENYVMNSATSAFYTCLGAGSNTSRDAQYCVFGKAKKFEDQMTNGLLAAIDEYIDGQDEDFEFTETVTRKLNELDHLCNGVAGYPQTIRDFFEDVRTGGATEDYSVPIREPITVKSIKINKY